MNRACRSGSTYHCGNMTGMNAHVCFMLWKKLHIDPIGGAIHINRLHIKIAY